MRTKYNLPADTTIEEDIRHLERLAGSLLYCRDTYKDFNAILRDIQRNVEAFRRKHAAVRGELK